MPVQGVQWWLHMSGIAAVDDVNVGAKMGAADENDLPDLLLVNLRCWGKRVWHAIQKCQRLR